LGRIVRTRTFVEEKVRMGTDGSHVDLSRPTGGVKQGQEKYWRGGKGRVSLVGLEKLNSQA